MIAMFVLIVVGTAVLVPLLQHDLKRAVRELEEQRRRAAEAEALAAAFRRAANQIGNLRAAFIGLGVAFEHAAASIQKAFAKVDQSAR